MRSFAVSILMMGLFGCYAFGQDEKDLEGRWPALCAFVGHGSDHPDVFAIDRVVVGSPWTTKVGRDNPQEPEKDRVLETSFPLFLEIYGGGFSKTSSAHLTGLDVVGLDRKKKQIWHFCEPRKLLLVLRSDNTPDIPPGTYLLEVKKDDTEDAPKLHFPVSLTGIRWIQWAVSKPNRGENGFYTARAYCPKENTVLAGGGEMKCGYITMSKPMYNGVSGGGNKSGRESWEVHAEARKDSANCTEQPRLTAWAICSYSPIPIGYLHPGVVGAPYPNSD